MTNYELNIFLFIFIFMATVFPITYILERDGFFEILNSFAERDEKLPKN